MELAKEHFDQTMTTLYKKFDTKIEEQTKELKAHAPGVGFSFGINLFYKRQY